MDQDERAARVCPLSQFSPRMKMELGRDCSRQWAMRLNGQWPPGGAFFRTIDTRRILTHEQCVRAFFRDRFSLGMGMKAFAYAHTEVDVCSVTCENRGLIEQGAHAGAYVSIWLFVSASHCVQPVFNPHHLCTYITAMIQL